MQQHNPYQAPNADFNASLDDQESDLTPVYSPAGRFGRLSYIAWTGVIGLSSGILMGILAPSLFLIADPDNADFGGTSFGVLLLLMIPIFVIGIIFCIRRLHDMDMSGWWCLAFIVPLLNLVIAIMLWFVPGTQGSNRFGPVRETLAWEKIFAWIYIVLMVLSTVGQILLLGTFLSSQ